MCKTSKIENIFNLKLKLINYEEINRGFKCKACFQIQSLISNKLYCFEQEQQNNNN